MKLIFLGTPEFAVQPLKAILNSQHEVLAVVCQPDKLGSRKKLEFSPVKKLALEMGINVLQYEKISREGLQDLIALKPDIMVTAAYGQMLSQAVLDVAPHGIINIHGSLLPELRGAAPIQYAILQGMKQTGITILQTVYKMDAGDMILRESLEIGDNETSGELFVRMSNLGAKLIVEALNLIESGNAQFVPQDESKATMCKKITADMEYIDFSKESYQVHNLVRALNPNPVAWTVLNGKRLKVFKTSVNCDLHSVQCGTVVNVTKKSLTVACGCGTTLDIVELQLENGRRMAIQDFLNGNKIAVGTILGKQ